MVVIKRKVKQLLLYATKKCGVTYCDYLIYGAVVD